MRLWGKERETEGKRCLRMTDKSVVKRKKRKADAAKQDKAKTERENDPHLQPRNLNISRNVNRL